MVEAFLVAVSAADDAAFLALRDLSETLGDEEDTGIIGGHMVSLLTAGFPSPGLVARRTNDADGGIPKALARSGEIHERLLARGYRPTNSNRYVRESASARSRPWTSSCPALRHTWGRLMDRAAHRQAPHPSRFRTRGDSISRLVDAQTLRRSDALRDRHRRRDTDGISYMPVSGTASGWAQGQRW
jgi:hypothetical protein